MNKHSKANNPIERLTQNFKQQISKQPKPEPLNAFSTLNVSNCKLQTPFTKPKATTTSQKQKGLEIKTANAPQSESQFERNYINQLDLKIKKQLEESSTKFSSHQQYILSQISNFQKTNKSQKTTLSKKSGKLNSKDVNKSITINGHLANISKQINIANIQSKKKPNKQKSKKPQELKVSELKVSNAQAQLDNSQVSMSKDQSPSINVQQFSTNVQQFSTNQSNIQQNEILPKNENYFSESKRFKTNGSEPSSQQNSKVQFQVPSIETNAEQLGNCQLPFPLPNYNQLLQFFMQEVFNQQKQLASTQNPQQQMFNFGFIPQNSTQFYPQAQNLNQVANFNIQNNLQPHCFPIQNQILQLQQQYQSQFQQYDSQSRPTQLAPQDSGNVYQPSDPKPQFNIKTEQSVNSKDELLSQNSKNCSEQERCDRFLGDRFSANISQSSQVAQKSQWQQKKMPMKSTLKNKIQPYYSESSNDDENNIAENSVKSDLENANSVIIKEENNEQDNSSEEQLDTNRLMNGQINSLKKQVDLFRKNQNRETQEAALNEAKVQNSAIYIQKCWRGYHTRRVIEYYLELIENQNAFNDQNQQNAQFQLAFSSSQQHNPNIQQTFSSANQSQQHQFASQQHPKFSLLSQESSKIQTINQSRFPEFLNKPTNLENIEKAIKNPSKLKIPQFKSRSVDLQNELVTFGQQQSEKELQRVAKYRRNNLTLQSDNEIFHQQSSPGDQAALIQEKQKALHELEKLKEDEINRWNEILVQVKGNQQENDTQVLQKIANLSESNRSKLLQAEVNPATPSVNRFRGLLKEEKGTETSFEVQKNTYETQLDRSFNENRKSPKNANINLLKRLSPKQNKHIDIQVDELSNLLVNLQIDQKSCKNSKKQLFEHFQPELEQQSSSSSSIFEQDSQKNALKEKKCLELSLSKNINSILSSREKAIEIRINTQTQLINQMLQNNMCSPKTYQKKKDQLDSWVQEEKEDLINVRKSLFKGIDKAHQIIEKTKRDLQLSQKFRNVQQINDLQDSDEHQFKETNKIKIVEEFNPEERDFKKKNQTVVTETLQDDFASEEFQDNRPSDVIEISPFNNYSENVFVSEFSCDRAYYQQCVEERINEQLELCYSKDKSSKLGIATNQHILQKYIQTLLEYVFQNSKQEFLNNLNTPFGFPPQKRLQLIHGYDSFMDQSYSDISMQEFNALPFILSEDLFIQFEQNVIGNGSEERQQIMKEFEHIHNKSIFDSFNEAINIYRPYYMLGGPPYIWSKTEKSFVPKPKTEKEVEVIIEKSKQQVLEWSGLLCGVLTYLDRPKNIAQVETGTIIPLDILLQKLTPGTDYISQTREEKLYKMLQLEIQENEYKWQIYEDEKAEVIMEVGDLVFEELMSEVVLNLNSIYDNQQQRLSEK